VNALRFFEHPGGRTHLFQETILCGAVAGRPLQERLDDPERGCVCLRCLQAKRRRDQAGQSTSPVTLTPSPSPIRWARVAPGSPPAAEREKQEAIA
jgi:hypothetical protein